MTPDTLPVPPNALEAQQLALKKAELALQQKELQLKLDEFERKRTQGDSKPLSESPLTLAIITGLIGLLGAGVSNWFQHQDELELEQVKYQTTALLERNRAASSLILKAIETGNPESATKNLQFLVKAGFIEDSLGAIAALTQRPEDAPVLPAGSPLVVPNTPSSREFFFRRYQAAFAPLPPQAQAVLATLFDYIEHDKEMNDIRYVAYVLASINYETANKWKPMIEPGNDATLNQRYAPTEMNGRAIGNTEAGDGARYKGRGFILISGRRNYRAISKLLGLTNTPDDLELHPERALDPLISYRALSLGMREGTFTGKKLSDFIKKDTTDYVNARRIINGLLHAGPIATDAAKFEAILRESLKTAGQN